MGNESGGERVLITGATEKLEKRKNEWTRRKHEDGRRWMWEKMEPCEDRSEEMGKEEGLWLNR